VLEFIIKDKIQFAFFYGFSEKFCILSLFLSLSFFLSRIYDLSRKILYANLLRGIFNIFKSIANDSRDLSESRDSLEEILSLSISPISQE